MACVTLIVSCLSNKQIECERSTKHYNMPIPFEFSGFGAKNFDTPLPTLYSGVEIPILEITPFSAY
jgi:hypothetical protein